MNVTQADIDRLERYVELLREVVELSDELPSTDELEALPGHLKNLQAIAAANIPTDSLMDQVANLLSDLQDIKEYSIPSNETMQATRQHLEALQAIEELAVN